MKKILIAFLLASSPVFATVGDTSLGRATFTGNASQTVFTFTYPVAKITDIVVTLGSGSITNFVTLNSDQTSHPGGTVTFTSAPGNGVSVKIERDMQLTQTTSLSPYFPFPAKTVELTFDRTIELIQQVQRNLSDAIISGGGGGSGSISLAMPGDFTVAGSPGASITVSRNSQNQHFFLGAPYTGNGTPVYRAMDPSDLPASGASAATYGDGTHVSIFTLTLAGTISSASTSSTALAGINLANTFTLPQTITPAANGDSLTINGSNTSYNGITIKNVKGPGIYVSGFGGGPGWNRTARTLTVSGKGAPGGIYFGSDSGTPNVGGEGLVAYGGAGNGGSADGTAFVGYGGPTGIGGEFFGGATSGDGLNATALGGNANGLTAAAHGTGSDVRANSVDARSSTVLSLGTKPITSAGVALGQSGTVTAIHGRTVSLYGPNFASDASTGNNALIAVLVDESSVNVPLATGLRMCVGPLTHSLQAGADTFTFNTVSKSIKSSRDGTSNIGTAYSGAGVICLVYDGTEWLDLSQ